MSDLEIDDFVIIESGTTSQQAPRPPPSQISSSSSSNHPYPQYLPSAQQSPSPFSSGLPMYQDQPLSPSSAPSQYGPIQYGPAPSDPPPFSAYPYPPSHPSYPQSAPMMPHPSYPQPQPGAEYAPFPQSQPVFPHSSSSPSPYDKQMDISSPPLSPEEYEKEPLKKPFPPSSQDDASAPLIDGIEDFFASFDVISSNPPKRPALEEGTSVSIPTWELRTSESDVGGCGSSGREKTYYDVLVTYGGKTRQLRKTYDDFCALSSFISSQFANASLPPFPGRFSSLFSSRSEKANTRRIQLETFLRGVVGAPDLFASYEVLDFLSLAQEIDQVAPVQGHEMRGFFYLKVLEARGMPCRDGSKAPSCYVDESALAPVSEPQRVATFSSSKHADTTNPTWYEETLFTILDRRRPLRIKVMDHHMIRSDVCLGHVQLDLRAFVPYHLYDLTLPLSGTKEGTVRVIAQFNPSQIVTSLRCFPIPNFRIVMERSIYHPGEVVRGTLSLNVGQPIPCSSVLLRVFGITRTHWTKTHTTHTTDSKGHTHTHTHTEHYQQTYSLLDGLRVCWVPDGEEAGSQRRQEGSGEKIIWTGSYIWPFEFQLPVRLPPSVEYKVGTCTMTIEYGVKATIVKPSFFSINTRISCPFTLKTPYSSLEPIPPVYGHTNKLPFRSADQTVWVQGNLLSPVSILGSTQTANVLIENLTSKNVEHLDISVNLSHIARAHAHTHSHCSTMWRGKVKDTFPVLPGQSRNVIIPFPLALELPPTLPSDLSPLIELSYTVQISCPMSGFLTGYATADIPMIVSQPHVHPGAPPPPAPFLIPSSNKPYSYGVGALPRWGPQYFAHYADPSLVASDFSTEEEAPSNQQSLLTVTIPGRNLYQY